MTDQEILAFRESGMSRAAIAAKAGKTEKQVKSALERARRDPAVGEAMAAIGTNMVPSMVWVKTATHSVQLKPEATVEKDLIARVADAFKDIPAYEPVATDHEHSDLLAVYPMYDLHAGMLAWGRETRGPDFDLDLFRNDLIASVTRLSERAPKAGHALIVVGGDAIHVNDHTFETPASHHKQDADGRFEKIIDVAIEAISHAIEILAEKHARVSVVVLRGNHDEIAHVFLKVGLKQRYRNCDRIQFPIIQGADKSEVFWMQHGEVLIAAHHGDKAKPDKLAMIIADQCGFWSNTRHRVILTGHVHHLRTLDLPGVTHYTMRAFAPPDAYGANFGGVRGLQVMTFCPKHGLIAQTHDSVWRE